MSGSAEAIARHDAPLESFACGLRLAERTGDLDAQLHLLLSSGGDERIWPDPGTTRNKYGTPVAPASGEIWLSSSTASAISPRGYAAARSALAKLLAGEASPSKWFDGLRWRIAQLYGVPGAEVVLSASGTEAELLALTIARHCLARPLVNIVIAPEETGSGVLRAAGGLHFLSSTALGGLVDAGSPIVGWEGPPIEVQTVSIRDALGRPRDAGDVDADVREKVARIVSDGKDALVHVLDASKTGLRGPSRDFVRELQAQAGDRAMIVVDACQLRSPADLIRSDLRAGRLAMISGSKFAGGPPFSGALLIPSQILSRLGSHVIPEGLADYSARLDWPAALGARVGAKLTFPANLGLGLRWEAALAELEAFAAIEPALTGGIVDQFAEEVCRRVDASARLDIVDRDARPRSACCKTIIPIFTLGAERPLERAQRLHRTLREKFETADLEPVCHVGQPVAIGDKAALRICLSAPIIVDIAQGAQRGGCVSAAFASIQTDLDRVFRKWEAVTAILDNEA